VRDGTRHRAEGRFLALRPPAALTFEMTPVDAAGVPLFTSVNEVRLAPRRDGTRLTMAIRVRDARPEAAPALAGMAPGWEQTLAKLADVLGGGA